jgi:hypothetical protein
MKSGLAAHGSSILPGIDDVHGEKNFLKIRISFFRLLEIVIRSFK